MRDDVLIQAIDNTEDVLLHGAKWSEEAKQRVRQARRAGRRVSEMFGDLYKNSRRAVDKVDSKYNITEHNGRTRALYNKERRNANRVIGGSGEMLTNPQGGKRRDQSLEARLRQKLNKQSKTKYADKQFKDNMQRYSKAATKYRNDRARKKKKMLNASKSKNVVLQVNNK